MISSTTSFLALIGNPVKHSLSPIMHNAALKYLEIDLIYLAIPCKNTDFDLVINSLKKINCRGLNITIPFKEKAFNLCNEISPLGKSIKAINTLKLNNKEEWIGTNTDVAGFIYPLQNFNLENKRAIILGSGGAARSSIQGLIDLKLGEIIVISRNKNTLINIIKDFKDQKKIEGLLINKPEIIDLLNSADLIVNTTPVGMNKIENDYDLLPFGKNFWRSINSNTIIYDLIYTPNPTALLHFASKKNCPIIDGSEMLIAQGAKSLTYWTNRVDIPIEIMRDAIKNYL